MHVVPSERPPKRYQWRFEGLVPDTRSRTGSHRRDVLQASLSWSRISRKPLAALTWRLISEIAFPAEDRTPVVLSRFCSLVGDEGLERDTITVFVFKPPRLVVESLQGVHTFVGSERRLLHGGLQDTDGLVIDLDRDRVGVPILAAVRQRESCRITESKRRTVDNLRNHRQRLHRPRSDSGRKKQFWKVLWTAFGRGRECAVKSANKDVARADLMVGRHHEVRQLGQGNSLAGYSLVLP